MTRKHWEDISLGELRHVWDYCAKHRVCFNGMTHHVLYCQYGEAMRHQRGVGWQKISGSKPLRLHPRMLGLGD